jgi:c-di-AMP phosphodiesterase-like protein
MQKYEKYKTIHRISYIVFFSYLLILAVGNFDFGEYTSYIPYFIVVPFLIYCTIAVSVNILIRKERAENYFNKKKGKEPNYKREEIPALSDINHVNQ